MIDTKTTVSLRGQRQRDRMEKLRANVPPGIRVTPRDDDMRRVLKHPTAGGFRKEGAATWPDDRFTKRRLLDGTVKRDEEQKPDERGRKPEHQRRSPPGAGDAA
jgi:hypothetical protein